MDNTWTRTKVHSEHRFCILEYRHDGSVVKQSSCPARPVLLVIDSSDGIRLLVAPDLASIVCEDDRAYIDELIADFVKRSAQLSGSLFQQLSSLSVGPLVTQKLGMVGQDDLDLKRYCSNFIAL